MKKRALLLCLFGLSLSLSAQRLPLKSVSVFKNQSALLMRQGDVSTTDKKATLTDLPDALWGTFWIGGQVDFVHGRLDTMETMQDVTHQYGFLKQNEGKPISVWFSKNANETEEVSGVLEKVVAESTNGGMRAINIKEFIVVKKENGNRAFLDLAKISHFEFSGNLNFKQSSKTVKKAIDVGFSSKKATQNITMQYLTGGLGWTPLYRLDLLGKEKATLSLRAELVNDAEDLDISELQLMVGIPNFQYASRLSDMLVFDQQRDYRAPSISGGARNIASQMSNVAVFNPESYEEVVVPTTGGDEIEGNQAEDYFFYTVAVDNFPKNTRYQVPVFTTELQTTHFYECILKEVKPARLRYSNQPDNERYIVNHLVEFRNETQFPWTTGVANVATKIGEVQQAVSQDMLPYTASGGKCKVKIAETPEIQVSHIEGTTDMKPNALPFWNHNYDKATIEGQVCVVNYKKEKVTVQIRRSIEGNMLSSEQHWTVNQQEAALSVNRKNEVLWEFELAPNEEKKWTYSYEVFGDW